MLSTNVLCIKKKKRKGYHVTKLAENQQTSSKSNRPISNLVAMLPITEDTPPDMLTGAMDLTVHLPGNKGVKMSVERSTPMMDLLIQITNHHHLQLSNYTLHALSMAPSAEFRDKILPYKPNTPIGALDTQHIKVVPKSKSISMGKSVPVGEQPFESTFRLKIHLPRNQLYVTRVSQNVHLRDIMNKVCEEKGLDATKYELRHPDNLNEKLDPNLSLSDYQITEVYILSKGTVNINQVLSSTDIMVLRKEEERKQMHSKTGGGVFNLIFRRGKQSPAPSVPSENHANNSPAHSDNFRSVMPADPPPPPPQLPVEAPKPPQRKRRPAPKPPKAEEVAPQQQNCDVPVEIRKSDSSLTICHSRNSSDSSGYHEASVLSDNCNMSLPRRPNSSIINDSNTGEEGTSNMKKMSARSKSALNLAYPSRKKKIAPPPPPVLKSTVSLTNLDNSSQLVASHSLLIQPESDGVGMVTNSQAPEDHDTILPVPRPRLSLLPRQHKSSNNSDIEETVEEHCSNETSSNEQKTSLEDNRIAEVPLSPGEDFVKRDETSTEAHSVAEDNEDGEDSWHQKQASDETVALTLANHSSLKNDSVPHDLSDELTLADHTIQYDSVPYGNDSCHQKQTSGGLTSADHSVPLDDNLYQRKRQISELQKQNIVEIFNSGFFANVGPQDQTESQVLERSANFQTGSSVLNDPDHKSPLNSNQFDDEIEHINIDMFSNPVANKFEDADSDPSISPLPDPAPIEDMSPNTHHKLVVETLSNTEFATIATPEEAPTISLEREADTIQDNDKSEIDAVQKNDCSNLVLDLKPEIHSTESNGNQIDDKYLELEEEDELEAPWQYQLPSPPKAFRDSSPVTYTASLSNYEAFKAASESVPLSSDIIKKLEDLQSNQIEKETVSDTYSIVSEEEKPLLNKLSLEHLERRRSLVYKRELATSLQLSSSENTKETTYANSLEIFERTYEEFKKSSQQKDALTRSNLPNFQITTYDNVKQVDIFEDDSIRSNTDNKIKQQQQQQKSVVSVNNTFESYAPEPTEQKAALRYADFINPNGFNHQLSRDGPVVRSGSFSKQQEWSPLKPVARSKSHITINKRYDERRQKQQDADGLSKSNSLFDVSGLQSLEVIRLIQNKLNCGAPVNPEPAVKRVEEPQITVDQEQPTIKRYHYEPPTISMGTWSDRPKIPVNVKDDPDYKYGHSNNAQPKLASNNHKTSISYDQTLTGGTLNNTTTIAIKETDPLSSHTSSVIITGADVIPKPFATYRRPLRDVNKIELTQRSNDCNYDERLPVVRSVELKKSYDGHNHNSIKIPNSSSNHIRKAPYESNSINRVSGGSQSQQEPFKFHSLSRPKSQPPMHFSNPVVYGFQHEPSHNHQIINRLAHSTAPKTLKAGQNLVKAKSEVNLNVGNEVTRTSSTLTNIQSSPKLSRHHVRNQERKPLKTATNPRDDLLEAIRNFGGKKGLKIVKV